MTGVTQGDREAAAAAVMAYRDQKNHNWQQRIRDGLCDDGVMVQAFAAHRIAALEEAAKVAEGHGYSQGYITFAGTIATAIRNLKGAGA